MDESQQGAPVEVEVGRVEPVPAATRRRRAMTGVVAAMLVAGSGGLGFGLGRSLAENDQAPAAEPPTTNAATLAPVTDDPAATTVPSTITSAEAEGSDVVAASATTMPGGAVSASIVVDQMTGPGYEPLDTVWEGTTDDGLRLRLQTGSPVPDAYYGVGNWSPAAFCFGSAQMRLTIDGPSVVDIAIGMWFSELYGSAEVAYVGDVGVSDRHPMRLAVVQVADDVEQVTIDYDDGVSVTAPAEGGAAVLLADGGGAWNNSFDLELAFADGTFESVLGGAPQRDADPAWHAACSPPPPVLPAAGEQPSDPDAARAAIGDRFALLWDRSVDASEKPVLLDDDAGVDAAIDAVFLGGFATTAESAVHRIDELVFTAPDRAWFRYSIDTDVSFFADRYGVAKLTADGWIFPRALVCQDLALAGANCDPASEIIYPPSWYEVNEQQCVYDATGEPARCVGYEGSAVATW